LIWRDALRPDTLRRAWRAGRVKRAAPLCAAAPEDFSLLGEKYRSHRLTRPSTVARLCLGEVDFDMHLAGGQCRAERSAIATAEPNDSGGAEAAKRPLHVLRCTMRHVGEFAH